MKMKTSLLAIAAVLPAVLMAGSAQAADYGLAPASYDWSGGYVGVNGGMGFNMSSTDTRYVYTGNDLPTAATADTLQMMNFSSDPSDSRFTGGVLAGYNWQAGNFVVGLEGDFNYLGFSGNERHNADDAMGSILGQTTTGTYDTVNYDGYWYGTVRGRLGYAFDNLMVYGTGGLAYGDMSIDEKLSAVSRSGTGLVDQSIAWSGSNSGTWRFGWTLGAGMEYGVDRWTLGLEYLYVDLGSYDWQADKVGTLSDQAAQAEWDQVAQKGSYDYRFGVARASIKYRF